MTVAMGETSVHTWMVATRVVQWCRKTCELLPDKSLWQQSRNLIRPLLLTGLERHTLAAGLYVKSPFRAALTMCSSCQSSLGHLLQAWKACCHSGSKPWHRTTATDSTLDALSASANTSQPFCRICSLGSCFWWHKTVHAQYGWPSLAHNKQDAMANNQKVVSVHLIKVHWWACRHSTP